MSAAEKPVEWTCEGSRKLHEGMLFGFHARVKADGALTVNNRVSKGGLYQAVNLGGTAEAADFCPMMMGQKTFF